MAESLAELIERNQKRLKNDLQVRQKTQDAIFDDLFDIAAIQEAVDKFNR